MKTPDLILHDDFQLDVRVDYARGRDTTAVATIDAATGRVLSIRLIDRQPSSPLPAPRS